MTKAARTRLACTVRLTTVAALIVVVTFPVYWMILTSFRSETDIVSRPPHLLPATALTLQNYRNVLSGMAGNVRITEPALVFIRNSVVVAVFTTALSVLIAAPAAYALVRLRFRGREAAATAVLIAYLVPTLALMVPVFVLLVKLGLHNSLQGLILVETVFNLPIALWLLRGYMINLPVDVEEAAFIDGCGRLQAIGRVVLPMALPGFAVVSLVCFLNAWNSYLFPLILLRQNGLKTAPLGMSIYLNEQIGMVWGEMMAAGTLIALPVLIVFFMFQRYLIGGLTVGAVKG